MSSKITICFFRMFQTESLPYVCLFLATASVKKTISNFENYISSETLYYVCKQAEFELYKGYWHYLPWPDKHIEENDEGMKQNRNRDIATSIISVRYRSITVSDWISLFRTWTGWGIGIRSFRYRTDQIRDSLAFLHSGIKKIWTKSGCYVWVAAKLKNDAV
jgi:hypothetical protein